MLRLLVLLSLSALASCFSPPAALAGGRGACAAHRGLQPAVCRRATEPEMMAKKVTKMIKLALDAGKANPAPPVGPALGAAGVNIMMFCKEYNARTQDKVGTVIPVEISVFEDRSFTFILKTPPASVLLKKAAKVSKGSGTPCVIDKKGERSWNSVGTVTMAQIQEIAETKMPDLNTNKLQSAMNTVMGTAKNMGSKLAPTAKPSAFSLCITLLSRSHNYLRRRCSSDSAFLMFRSYRCRLRF